MPINYEREIVRMKQSDCKHDTGFHCQSMPDNTYIMACNWRCGYYLRFSPEDAGRYRKENWKEATIYYPEKDNTEGKRITLDQSKGW